MAKDDEAWRAMKIFAVLKEACMDLLFPPVCAACEISLPLHRSSHLCPECRQGIRFLRAPVCPLCGAEQPGDENSGHLCGTCLAEHPPYDLARSLVRYETTVRQLIHRLKYRGDTLVAGALRDLVRSEDLLPFATCDHIVPVPLHRQRLQTRGLNQAGFLARLLFPERLPDIRFDGLLRVRKTVAQTELRGADRRKNLRNAFALNIAFNPDRSIVCLVDDVLT